MHLWKSFAKNIEVYELLSNLQLIKLNFQYLEGFIFLCGFGSNFLYIYIALHGNLDLPIMCYMLSDVLLVLLLQLAVTSIHICVLQRNSAQER